MKLLKTWWNDFVKRDKVCTFYPDGNWRMACRRHDKIYSKDSKSNFSRLQADNQLFLDVKNSGHPIHATVMWLGIRCFGWMFWKSK